MRCVVLALSCLLLAVGCAGRAQTIGTEKATLRASCSTGEVWNGRACQARGDGAVDLERGAAALEQFRVEDALTHLQSALAKGPHLHREYARIFENLGIAHAYLGQESEALSAFDMLLALSPEHLLSYTLSPKATFVFENARTQAAGRPRPELQISWPYDLDVTRPVPIDIAVIADPKGYLKTAEVLVRRKGEAGFSAFAVELPEAGGHTRVTLPALPARKPEILEVYATARDGDGNQVLLWANPQRPRELALGYTAPVRWYRKWWVWATIGAAVAVGTGATVYGLTRQPPDTVGGTLTFDAGGIL